jgi:hypothetical protein
VGITAGTTYNLVVSAVIDHQVESGRDMEDFAVERRAEFCP